MSKSRLILLQRFGALGLLQLAFATLALGGGAPAADTKDPSACLPFSMPDSATLFKAQKKVFAHYFYVFPLSIGNKPADSDYYNAQYLNPQGENGKHAALGGYLRQRPLPVAAHSSADQQLQNVETEVRMAIARGITGFTIDVLSGKEAGDSNSHLNMLLKAAKAVDPRFKIVVMPDISALKADANAVFQIIAAAAASDAAYRLDDGRLVVSAFNAALNPPAWWQSIFDQLSSRGIKVAFVPTFLGWSGQAASFAAISHGFSDWGTATAASSDHMKSDPSLAHDSYGKLYMMPVDPQQYRPKDSIFWEAGNSTTFRTAWMSAINAGADWVQLVTWSDFSESSQVEPYTDATLRTDIGTGFYDLTGYYAAWFLLGMQPPITHDVLYYFYRREPTNAASPAQSVANKLVGNAAAENNIELVAFLTAPATLKITIGGQSFTQEAAAGISSFKVPSAPGNPQFTLSRNGADVFSFQGPVQIYGTSGLPSGVIDMTYWSGSASKSGVCAL
jgi:Glycosyl hydrolase family 71